MSFEASLYERCVFHSTRQYRTIRNEVIGIHKLAATLATRGVLKSTEEQLDTSRTLHQIEQRARQWEATGSFRIRSPTNAEYNVLLPLNSVRPALNVRVVNSFLNEKNGMVYTIWVYDIDDAREWYAPVRFHQDFVDLRAALTPLYDAVAKIPFPRIGRFRFGSPIRQQESDIDSSARAWQLESFLRNVVCMIYRERLHPAAAELAMHVQTFLGCGEARLLEPRLRELPEWSDSGTEASVDIFIRGKLQRSLQKHTHRIFMLDAMKQMIDPFVEGVRSRQPDLGEMEVLQVQGHIALKQKALQDLEHVEAFLDFLQDILLESCMEEYCSIASREEYELVYRELKHDESQWTRLVHEAIRAQIEIEVYVPLRSVVSRWLVYGWKHEDMEVHFKMNELRVRPQSFFCIPQDKQLESASLQLVIDILKVGVGRRTLPCTKLRAILKAARAISSLLANQGNYGDRDGKEGSANSGTQYLGADDFLPIFIYCVVQADMERPCALCVLLRTLCDRMNRIGEVGYYLASFEAAITHIQELDLSQNLEEMQSFLPVPL